ncbi:hypothetical protein SKAU_G00091570 [Synaphobranchus kaupii]|uniref:BPTI/Kunitz inhibitor domain-containing protein n=1 Tax=Synaphobranchus kaupii TaxID=118154 RepID=A0A9Q1FWH8_SYNKA|nr:hypothetical protein SKAU_G00091570 [Synaphobranchus kaupii]
MTSNEELYDRWERCVPYAEPQGIHSLQKKLTTPKFEGKSADSTDCTAPMMVGHCRAALPRFFYNGTSCQPFLYGGCLGNSNNFETLDACQAACNKTPGAAMSNDVPSAPAARRIAQADTNVEHCQAKAMTGPCRASIPRYFYNGTTCQRFIFGGCKGNQNNYGSVEECQTTCTVTVIPSPRKAPEGNSSDNKDSCTAKQETGPCRGRFPRASTLTPPPSPACPFIYGGCQGNGKPLRLGGGVHVPMLRAGKGTWTRTHFRPAGLQVTPACTPHSKKVPSSNPGRGPFCVGFAQLTSWWRPWRFISVVVLVGPPAGDAAEVDVPPPPP